MALIKCPECTGTISDKALSCPHCGYPLVGGTSLPMRKSKGRKRRANGSGTIVKLSGNRAKPFQVRVNTHIDKRGYPVFDVLGTYENRVDADIALAKYNRAPYDVSSRSLTFSEVYEMYYRDKYELSAKKLSKSSIYCTRSAYGHCMSLYDKIYSKLRKEDFQEVLLSNNEDGKPLSHALQEHIQNLFRQMDKYAMRNDMIEKGYAAYADITVEEDDEHGVPFTDEELDLLWKHKGDPFVDTLLIYCYSGWRLNELARMPLANIDLGARTFKGGLKNRYSKNRTVPIHTAIYDLVAARYDTRYKSLIYHDSKHNISQMTYRGYFNDALIRCGIQGKHTPHDCRHTFNKLLEDVGADRVCRYKLMGHAGKDINENVYSHKTIEQLRDAVECIKIKP